MVGFLFKSHGGGVAFILRLHPYACFHRKSAEDGALGYVAPSKQGQLAAITSGTQEPEPEVENPVVFAAQVNLVKYDGIFCRTLFTGHFRCLDLSDVLHTANSQGAQLGPRGLALMHVPATGVFCLVSLSWHKRSHLSLPLCQAYTFVVYMPSSQAQDVLIPIKDDSLKMTVPPLTCLSKEFA